MDGEMAAFTLGECERDTMLVRLEKALDQYEGIYAFINREFAEHGFEGISWINREEDMGIPGLRRSKQSYYPDHMVKKYQIDFSGCRGARMTPVVAGVIRRDGRYMLARRVRGAEAGCWEFPAASWSRENHPNRPLERELREELGDIGARRWLDRLHSRLEWHGRFGTHIAVLQLRAGGWRAQVSGLWRRDVCGGARAGRHELAHNDREFVERWLHTGGQKFNNG